MLRLPLAWSSLRRSLLAALLAAVTITPTAIAAVVFDAASSGATTASATGVTRSHTIGSATNLMLVVGVSLETAITRIAINGGTPSGTDIGAVESF